MQDVRLSGSGALALSKKDAASTVCFSREHKSVLAFQGCTRVLCAGCIPCSGCCTDAPKKAAPVQRSPSEGWGCECPMEMTHPAVLPAQHQGHWRLMCCCQEWVKARASLQRATLPGTETSFSCCRATERLLFSSTDISRRPGRESRWEPASGQLLPLPTPW